MRAAAVLLAVALAAPAHAADAPTPRPAPRDDAPDGLPVEAIGRVNSRAGGFCTGTLVSNRTVLTAAHCLWNNRTKAWLPPDSLHFLAGYDRGAYKEESAVLRWDMPRERREAGERGRLDLDWAVLVLERTIGATTGTVGLADTQKLVPADGRPVAVVHAAYRRDRAHALSIEARCGAFRPGGGQPFLLHDCAVTKGASGAPVLIRTGGEYRILGVGIATIPHAGRQLGLAVPATAVELPE